MTSDLREHRPLVVGSLFEHVAARVCLADGCQRQRHAAAILRRSVALNADVLLARAVRLVPHQVSAPFSCQVCSEFSLQAGRNVPARAGVL